ncbi:Outer membrane protein assembly factor BamA [Candidatus Desulfarcum epimagneticum]|uniref:Outer membrane protein assembly factor BamA n=1 Tax=uncultured Desulfobacteraceae bacterium TaxID=218296 RepID=A0A484HJ16_9BACT|nr:Outer membrane protein assembly factor BamA [uncultured Desulfobacteraceae bacterium]
MMKRLPIYILMLVCFFSDALLAREPVNVLVLPFEIHAAKNVSYLKSEISSVIKTHLKNDGATLVEQERDIKGSGDELEDLRSLGIWHGADYVIHGSLSWIDKRISLDARMITSFENNPPYVFFVEGESIQNLPATIKKLANHFGKKLFKLERIKTLEIKGNALIGKDAIEKRIESGPGDIYNPGAISRDIKAVYKMGFFDDIRIEAMDDPDGKNITFYVKEKPTVHQVKIRGNKTFDDEKVKESLTLKTGSFLDIVKVNRSMERVEEFYKGKNYHNVHVSYKTEDLDKNQVNLTFDIKEGKKALIKKIVFTGNVSYKARTLLGKMKISEKSLFSFITSAGDLDRDDLSQDIERLKAHYATNGYMDVKISEPVVEIKEKSIFISIGIDEGSRFSIGKVSVDGDMIMPAGDLKKALKITDEEFFNREIVRRDILRLSDIYTEKSYAKVDISPVVKRNPEKSSVDITYRISKGKQFFIGQISIAGNTNTRDKVIRRQLKLYEADLYDSKKLKRSVRNLNRTGYFEEVSIEEAKGDSDEKLDIKVRIKEKPTGAFTVGGGHSSVNDFFFMASVAQNNLFGRGQTLKLQGEVGGTSNKYTLSFTEPWLFDIPLSAGFDVYNWIRDYATYDKDSKGGGIRLGYGIFDYTRLYFSYSYDISDIENVNFDAPESIKDMAESGDSFTESSVSSILRYDSTDRPFNPTEGFDHRLTVKYAGLGGDLKFTKYIGDSGWYFPIFKGIVGFLHARAGYVIENRDSPGGLPDYERFYLGGMNSLRGFDWQDIYPEEYRKDVAEKGKKGGDKFVQFNAELILPLPGLSKAGMVGVLFFDAGDVFDHKNVALGDLRQSAGYGIRWLSPIGPIRLENGYVINAKEGENKGGRWEFTMGAAF